MATPYTRSPRRDDEWQQEHRQSMTVRRSLGLLLALRRGHEAERNGLHTHRKNTHQMHWSAYALRISTSIRCNAVAQPPSGTSLIRVAKAAKNTLGCGDVETNRIVRPRQRTWLRKNACASHGGRRRTRAKHLRGSRFRKTTPAIGSAESACM